MQPNYFAHPNEDTLERFALRQCEEEEVETIETHLLACSSCLDQLEEVQQHIDLMKLTLRDMERERIAKESRAAARWKNWFTLPRLSFAAAVACAALSIAAFIPANVELQANRGYQTVVAPEWRPLQVSLPVTQVANGPVKLEVVSDQGSLVWKGNASVHNDRLKTGLPRFTSKGSYLFRVYEPGTSGQLLIEAGFVVR